MKGHIRKRGNRWVCIVYLGRDPATRRPRYKWETVSGNQGDAQRRLRELLHQLDIGVTIKPGKTTLAGFLENWLQEYARVNLSPRSFDRYAGIVQDRLIPELGAVQLTQLKPEHLQRYYSKLLKTGLSPATVAYHHRVLHIALATAVKWGLAARNAADAVDPPRIRRGEMQTWSENEVNRFLESSRGSRYYPLWYTALFTGMRRSELLALRWQDIDFILGEIRVVRGLHQLRNGTFIFTEPKSSRSRRNISMPPSLFLTLEAYRKAREIEGTMIGRQLREEDLVFSSIEPVHNKQGEDLKQADSDSVSPEIGTDVLKETSRSWEFGRPLRPNTVTRAWSMAAIKAGVKPIRLHDARHTHASLMLKQGIHPKIVQERLGHSSIQMTLDTYSHVTPGLQEAAAKRFDDIFAKGERENAESHSVDTR